MSSTPVNKSGEPAAPGRTDEFYVGYLPLPRGIARELRWIIPLLLIGTVALGVIVTRGQRDPGPAVWDDSVARKFVGRVEALPYPHIRIATGKPAAPVESLMLVEIGKFGGGQRAKPLAGKMAEVSGWLLERDGRRMIEMEPGDSLQVHSATREGEAPAEPPPARITSLGRMTLRGEIVDSKCYLGAMKPGDGKTHKQCATLCISGGIPPTLVTCDAAGARTYYLLANPDGGPLDESLLPFVADPIEVTGQAERRDDLLILQIRTSDIRRL